MLRPLETALLVLTSVGATSSSAGARPPGGSCAPKDARSDRLVSNFKAFVGKTDMGGTVEKTTMGLKDVKPSQIALVTDRAICTKAVAAFDAKRLQKRTSYTLYVVTIGSSYAVEDTKMLQEGFATAEVFDGSWKYIGVRQVKWEKLEHRLR